MSTKSMEYEYIGSLQLALSSTPDGGCAVHIQCQTRRGWAPVLDCQGLPMVCNKIQYARAVARGNLVYGGYAKEFRHGAWVSVVSIRLDSSSRYYFAKFYKHLFKP